MITRMKYVVMKLSPVVGLLVMPLLVSSCRNIVDKQIASDSTYSIPQDTIRHQDKPLLKPAMDSLRAIHYLKSYAEGLRLSGKDRIDLKPITPDTGLAILSAYKHFPAQAEPCIVLVMTKQLRHHIEHFHQSYNVFNDGGGREPVDSTTQPIVHLFAKMARLEKVEFPTTGYVSGYIEKNPIILKNSLIRKEYEAYKRVLKKLAREYSTSLK